MEVSGQQHAPAALASEEVSPVRTEYKAGSARQLVWSLWKTEKSTAPAANRHSIPHSSGRSLVTIGSDGSRLCGKYPMWQRKRMDNFSFSLLA